MTHEVRPPGTSGIYLSEDYARIWPFIWFPCEHPDRPLDEACLFDFATEGLPCEGCRAVWDRWGCPLPKDQIPPVPDDAPIFRGLPW